MNTTYSPSYLNLERRIAILPPPDPDERVKRLLEQLKETQAEYPPELLKARRESLIAQIEKSDRVPARSDGT